MGDRGHEGPGPHKLEGALITHITNGKAEGLGLPTSISLCPLWALGAGWALKTLIDVMGREHSSLDHHFLKTCYLLGIRHT